VSEDEYFRRKQLTGPLVLPLQIDPDHLITNVVSCTLEHVTVNSHFTFDPSKVSLTEHLGNFFHCVHLLFLS